MTDLESQELTTRDLVRFANARGVDLTPTCFDWAFFTADRFIWFWQNDGKVHYNMQGTVRSVPLRYPEVAARFRGMWSETGSVPNLEQAYAFLKAWLIDRKDVDDLPDRSIRREGVG